MFSLVFFLGNTIIYFATERINNTFLLLSTDGPFDFSPGKKGPFLYRFSRGDTSLCVLCEVGYTNLHHGSVVC